MLEQLIGSQLHVLIGVGVGRELAGVSGLSFANQIIPMPPAFPAASLTREGLRRAL